MSKIITDYKKIDFPKTALIVILKDGTVNAVPKIKGFDYHAEYLKMLIKSNRIIKDITSSVNMNYYLDNPSQIITDVYPLFSMEDATILINLAPNIYTPTHEYLGFFPEKVPKSTKNLFEKMNKQLSEINFFEIGKYNNNINFYEIYENHDPIKGDDKDILDIMNNTFKDFINKQKSRN